MIIYNDFNNFKTWADVWRYWFSHWCAFNMTALNLKVWRPRHLFHDAEKPWLVLLWGYDKADAWHRENSKHHYEHYLKWSACNFTDLVIDWECSRYTKKNGQFTPREYLDKLIRDGVFNDLNPKHIDVITGITKALDSLGL